MNTAKLKAAALAAGGEEWAPRDQTKNCGEYTVIVKGSLEKHSGWTSCRPVADEVVNKQTMKFIALANPAAVLELIAALEAADRRNAELNSTLERWATDRAQSASELEAAEKRNAELDERLIRYAGIATRRAEHVAELEKRVAELEARAVKLPKRSVGEVMRLSGFSREYAEGWCSGNDNARHEIQLAGINLETGGE
ncbi:ead/Ea22-like family protein [Cronobacter sakazakii]|nr:ead/Ea22-like family protein [Cronobacter sakazakii]ELU8381322.1 ead/Ea22-like family protein [Cronobacter sakazakii]ELU8421344.1 ead/Ea22-like family protein [Cronobacter sakazakii]ELU8458613.1 ead/Ea22-like family protein [Cronobacter sakazakii]ELU8530071.1 ead/Ea22-like family protein [Cronobacter sakazakii]